MICPAMFELFVSRVLLGLCVRVMIWLKNAFVQIAGKTRYHWKTYWVMLQNTCWFQDALHWTLFFWTLKLWWWKEEKAGTQRSTMGIFNVHASFRRCSFDQGGVNSSNVTSTDRRGILPKWPYFSESSLVKCLHSLRFTCQALDLWVLLPTSTTYITDSYGSNL